jgi:predicted transcriptional regulator
MKTIYKNISRYSFYKKIAHYYVNYMKYRSRSEIIAVILETANDSGGVNKTRIMYKAVLSYTQLKEYLSLIIENGLMEYLEGEHRYRITEKGIHFLQIYNRIRELITTTKHNERA